MILGNIPQFTVFRFELYRIVLSPFICPGLFSLIFAYISFVDNGRRLEFSMGSTAFFVLTMMIGVLTNLAFIALIFLLYGITGSHSLLILPSVGIWIILFGIIAIECSNAPPDSKRRLFFYDVPTQYYPLALFGLFSLLGGFSLSHLISIGVGFAYGYVQEHGHAVLHPFCLTFSSLLFPPRCRHGHLDKLKISDSRSQAWEETIFESFSSREGWVVSNNATGSGAWNDDMSSGVTGAGGFGFLSQLTQTSTRNSEPTTFGADGDAGSNMGSGSFPTGGGRQLGSASRRPASTTDARQTRLKAIERRANASKEENV